MDGAGAAPAPRTTPPRWGISDAAVAWIVSLVAAAIALAPFIDPDRNTLRPDQEALATFVGLVLQTAAVAAVLAFVARKKGRGSLATDFGLRLRLPDAVWVLGGLLLGGLGSLILLPIIRLGDINEKSQDVRRIFDNAHGFELALLVLGVVVIAPIGEELLFRGALLRGLQRRMPVAPAIFVSALVFALVHVVLDLGTAFGIPALLLMGLVSAWRAAETQTLSQSIYLHAGFNLVVVLARL
jgi:membrane protease YdiL (CAAX protease family)